MAMLSRHSDACLALALTRSVPAVTTEIARERCDVGVRMMRIR